MVNLYFLSFFKGKSILFTILMFVSVNAQVTFTDVTASAGNLLGEGTARASAGQILIMIIT